MSGKGQTPERFCCPSPRVRLTVDEHGLIREGTRQEIGPDRTVRLFGSRLDDSRRGGDIDWLVERPQPAADRLMTACRLAARLERTLGDGCVDVALTDPTAAEAPRHRIARSEGPLL